MTTQRKLILLFGISLGLLLISVIVFIFLGRARQSALHAEDQKSKQLAAGIAFNQSRDYLNSIVSDYSLWDELAGFKMIRDARWLDDNINSLFHSTSIKYVWIYNLKHEAKLRSKAADVAAIEDPVPPSEFDRLIDVMPGGSGRFCHFFLNGGGKVVEIVGAAISSSKDTDRKGAARGYIFFGAFIDSSIITRLQKVTGSKVGLYVGTPPPAEEKYETAIIKKLADWKGESVAAVSFVSRNKLAMAEDKYSSLSLVVYGLVIVIIVLIAYIIINRSVTRPLTKIVGSLSSENAELITSLRDNRDEFGLIAELINKFFEQKKEIALALDKISEQKTQLEALNATKDKFFSIIAHDLRNPFGVILATTEMIANPEFELTMEEIIDFSKDLHTTSKSLFELLENLLHWARSQRGTIDYKPDIINISDLARGTRELLSGQAGAKGIEIITPVEGDHYCYADKNMTMTVMRNLVSNAIKFTNEGGKVQINCRRADRDMLGVEVIDNGVGITEENLKKLFRIDVNLSTRGTSQETGTGLGLILCKEFVEKQGGKIEVESEPGRGTKFYFTLPLTEPAHEQHH